MTGATARDTARRLGGPGPLRETIAEQKRGEARGVFSICSAHPFVLEAALAEASARDGFVLVEATANQVNQDGGYTGETPEAFARALRVRADAAGLRPDLVLFGGDHLGPHPWRGHKAEDAMARAAEMVRRYVAAGAAKVHLDASMSLADDPPAGPPESVVADRTASLCAAAEEARSPGVEPPVYVVGTEVPPPGGETAEAEGPAVTRPEDAARALELTRAAFLARGLEAAWSRVVALVVQPGVEFGEDQVFDYEPQAARSLVSFIEGVPGIVYEAHSTDHQTEGALARLVRDHFAILKVGPGLTYAFREAVFALAEIEREWLSSRRGVALSDLRRVVDEAMRKDPAHWEGYYRGDEERRRLFRWSGLSDRIRYYWPRPEVQAALSRLLANLESEPVPAGLLSQYLPGPYRAVREGRVAPRPRDLVLFHVTEVLSSYARACGREHPTP